MDLVVVPVIATENEDREGGWHSLEKELSSLEECLY